MTSELQQIPKANIYHLADHCWMVENPDQDEHAFLFRLIQERHRTQFYQAVEPVEGRAEVAAEQLQELDAERDRAEEILYWLYLDSQLRQQGKTLPEVWEQDTAAIADLLAQIEVTELDEAERAEYFSDQADLAGLEFDDFRDAE